MKTLVIFLFSLAAILAAAIFTTGRQPDAALVLAGIFAASLAAWTVRQYQKKFHPLTTERPLRLPLQNRSDKPVPPAQRLAA